MSLVKQLVTLDVGSLLENLAAMGFSLTVEGSSIRVTPSGLPQDIKALIKARKPEIIAFLSGDATYSASISLPSRKDEPGTPAPRGRPRLPLADYRQFKAAAWDMRKIMYCIRGLVRKQAVKRPLNVAVKAISEAITELDRACRRDYPAETRPFPPAGTVKGART